MTQKIDKIESRKIEILANKPKLRLKSKNALEKHARKMSEKSEKMGRKMVFLTPTYGAEPPPWELYQETFN